MSARDRSGRMYRLSPLDCEIENDVCSHCGWVAHKPNLRRNCQVRMKAYFRWHWGDYLALVVRRWCQPAMYERLGFGECGSCNWRRKLLNSWGTSCERSIGRVIQRLSFWGRSN